MSYRTWIVVAALAVCGTAAAVDPPHWSSTSIDIDCTSQCHTLHHAEGGGLTQASSNVNLCQSCHRPSGLAQDVQLNDADKAVPGVGGTSHAFDALAVNPTYQTTLPIDTEMSLRVMDDNIVCSTCHDQHDTGAVFGGDSRISAARQVTSYGSTGAVVPGGDYTDAPGVWYLVEIAVAGNQINAEFRYSKDNGTTWFPADCCPRIEGSCVAVDTATCTPATGSTPSDLGFGVEITFADGDYEVDGSGFGDRWEFNAAWPFLRSTLGDGGSTLCAQCHQAWVMDHEAVEEWNGGSMKSHPVGVALNVNGEGYDRSAPLDGNGAPQGGAGEDANATNDLLLYSGSNFVECLSCHGVHHVDSNTLTVDGP